MPSTRRLKPANPADDGSGGRFVRGLPADATGLTPDPQVDYDHAAGAPRDPGGGRFTPNVSGARTPRPAPSPRPFKLK